MSRSARTLVFVAIAAVLGAFVFGTLYGGDKYIKKIARDAKLCDDAECLVGASIVRGRAQERYGIQENLLTWCFGIAAISEDRFRRGNFLKRPIMEAGLLPCGSMAGELFGVKKGDEVVQGKNPFDAPGMQIPDPYADFPPAETLLEHLADYAGIFAGSSMTPEVWIAVAILVWRGKDLERFALWLVLLAATLTWAQGNLITVVLKSPYPYPPAYNLVRLFFVLLIWGILGAGFIRLGKKAFTRLNFPARPQ